jgi:hypothetical protein
MKSYNINFNLSLALYIKAKESFERCIQNNDNKFLEDEIDVPLNDIIVIEKNIKIVFFKTDLDEYTIEICLGLFSGNEEIGKYTSILNEKYDEIDNFLVFY